MCVCGGVLIRMFWSYLHDFGDTGIVSGDHGDKNLYPVLLDRYLEHSLTIPTFELTFSPGVAPLLSRTRFTVPTGNRT